MPTILSPIRIARTRRTSFQNVEETFEIDFNLGLEQGIRIHAVEFGINNAVALPAADDIIDFSTAHLSLHIETGALEGAIDSFPSDNTILNSEILAETTLQSQGFTSSVPATSPDVINYIWLQPIAWNFHQLIGGALDIAQNLTFRGITSQATFTINGAQVTIYYQYIKLSKAELGEQFALRR